MRRKYIPQLNVDARLGYSDADRYWIGIEDSYFCLYEKYW